MQTTLFHPCSYLTLTADFNPDALEARDVKEEYDSDPSDTGSSDDEGSGSGSEGEKEKRRKVGIHLKLLTSF